MSSDVLEPSTRTGGRARFWSPFASKSVARNVIFCVGSVLVVMQLSLAAFELSRAKDDIQNVSAMRGDAALDMLTSLHTQAMLNRNGHQDHDPAIETLNGSMAQFSELSQDVKLWLVMSDKVIAFQRKNGQSEIERPRDAVDRRALETALPQTVSENGMLRLTRPVVLGQGAAQNQACAGCHEALMGIKSGEVVGAFSASVDMRPDLTLWRNRFAEHLLATLAIIVAIMGISWGLLHLTTLRPLTRLANTTRRLARGDLGVTIQDAHRADELGHMARALETFRGALLAKKTLEDRNAHMARHDALTDLPNRTSFNDRLEDATAIARRTGAKVAVVGIDLNRFKDINDRHGHAIGDQVLMSVGDRLSRVLQAGEMVARFGGDEFCALKPFKADAELEAFLLRLEPAIQNNVHIPFEGLDLSVGGSLGVAIFPDHAQTRDQLMNNADLAMYRAKSSIGDAVCFYNSDMDESIRERRSLAADLKEALEKGQFVLHYQAQKSITTDEIIGYEALLRWPHPVRGYVAPAVFIPVAEESGAILGIGDWVLRQACKDASAWPDGVRVAVNISPIQLGEVDLPSRVQEILMETGLPARRLELEITETTIIADKLHALHVLRRLKALGVSIAIDDFGTGYSSLDTLNAFPFDKIKIDRSFLAEAERRPQSRSIIRAILALGRSLEVPVLAEGVETKAQYALLQDEGCLEAQGFLLGLPQPVGEIGIGPRRVKMR